MPAGTLTRCYGICDLILGLKELEGVSKIVTDANGLNKLT
jgi:hypothetical protein